MGVDVVALDPSSSCRAGSRPRPSRPHHGRHGRWIQRPGPAAAHGPGPLDVVRRGRPVARPSLPRLVRRRQYPSSRSSRARQPHPARPHQRRGWQRLDDGRPRSSHSRVVGRATRQPARRRVQRLRGPVPAITQDGAGLWTGRTRTGAAARPSRLVTAVAVLIVLAAIAWAPLGADALHPEPTALVVVGAGILVSTPTLPWYARPLLALASTNGRPEWLGVVIAPTVEYLAVGDGAPLGAVDVADLLRRSAVPAGWNRPAMVAVRTCREAPVG